MSPSRLFAAYLADLASRSTDHHAATVQRQLALILAHVPKLDPEGVVKFRAHRLKEDRVSHRTCNAELNALSACFDWGLGMKLVKENPFRRQIIKRLPETTKFLRKRRRALTDAEVKRFLRESCRRDAELARTHGMTMLWRTLIETGMRWSECVSLTGANVVGETIILPAERTKSGEPREIPIRPMLAAKLRRLARNGSPLFPTPTGQPWKWNHHTALRILRNTLKRADIQERDAFGNQVDIHSLRHTCCTRLVRSGVRRDLVMMMLGHSVPRAERVNARYAHITTEDLRRELRRKVWRL